MPFGYWTTYSISVTSQVVPSSQVIPSGLTWDDGKYRIQSTYYVGMYVISRQGMCNDRHNTIVVITVDNRHTVNVKHLDYSLFVIIDSCIFRLEEEEIIFGAQGAQNVGDRP